MIQNNLLNYTTKAKFLQEKDQIKTEAIVFIQESNEIWTHEHGFQAIPAGGSKDQVLVKTETGVEWQNNTVVLNDDEIVTKLRIADSEEDSQGLLTKESADNLYATKESIVTGYKANNATYSNKVENGILDIGSVVKGLMVNGSEKVPNIPDGRITIDPFYTKTESDEKY